MLERDKVNVCALDCNMRLKLLCHAIPLGNPYTRIDLTTDPSDEASHAGVFNEDYVTILKVMETMGIIIGQQCKLFADYADKWRLTYAEIKSADTTKKARMASQSNVEKLHDFYEESEGLESMGQE
ncbi:hypothetical protein EAI_04992 [Harpegnathos saltator]|uniref:Uncharacterized protein n=1 Tax=Harpegnathos saltator TaxID=610380 RepID=E2C183_HARSA|nr:hypothetical protein EAI_04992 [Harpegnathos saltator]